VKGRRLATFAAAAVRVPGGGVSPVSAGFILLDQEVLEMTRHVAKFAVDQKHVAAEPRRRRLVAKEVAHETVVVSHDVLQTAAKFSNLRQLLPPGGGLVSVSFPF
jgi:hypothetical protein